MIGLKSLNDWIGLHDWKGGLPIIFYLKISFSWVELWMHTEFQLPSLPKSGTFMVGDKQQQQKLQWN